MNTVEFIGSGNAFNENGRNSQCILIKFGLELEEKSNSSNTLFVDFGPQSVSELRKKNFDFNSFDHILLTHFHGDHIAGIPFLILNFKYLLKRDKTINIIGPEGTKEIIEKLYLLYFPGSEINWKEINVQFLIINPKNELNLNDEIIVQSFPMHHKKESLGYKIINKKSNKIIAVSGDTGLNSELKNLRENANLFICECSSIKRLNNLHLAYDEIYELFKEDSNIILNHVSNEIVNNEENIKYKIANDGDIFTF